MSKRPAKFIILGVYLCGLGLLLYLGGWQLSRGLEKQAIEDQLGDNEEKAFSVTGSVENWQTYHYKNIELQGKWLDEKLLLMENRVFKGRVGFELYVPFSLSDDDKVVLVNLGWIESEKTIAEIPLNNVLNRGAEIGISGQFYIPEKGFSLGPAMIGQQSWPKRMLYFDQSLISDQLGISIAPGVVVIDPNEESAQTRIWQAYVIDPIRHFGYAFQWWGLALVMMIFGLIWFKNGKSTAL